MWDILSIYISSLHQANGLHKVGYKQTIDNESRSIFSRDTTFAHGLTPIHHRLESLIWSLGNTNNLFKIRFQTPSSNAENIEYLE